MIITNFGELIILNKKEYSHLIDRLETALEKNLQYEAYILDLTKDKVDRKEKIVPVKDVLENVI